MLNQGNNWWMYGTPGWYIIIIMYIELICILYTLGVPTLEQSADKETINHICMALSPILGWWFSASAQSPIPMLLQYHISERAWRVFWYHENAWLIGNDINCDCHIYVMRRISLTARPRTSRERLPVAACTPIGWSLTPVLFREPVISSYFKQIPCSSWHASRLNIPWRNIIYVSILWRVAYQLLRHVSTKNSKFRLSGRKRILVVGANTLNHSSIQMCSLFLVW